MRVYGKIDQGYEFFKSVVKAQIDYYTVHNCNPTHLELSPCEFSILQEYLQGLAVYKPPKSLTETNEILGMKLVIKD